MCRVSAGEQTEVWQSFEPVFRPRLIFSPRMERMLFFLSLILLTQVIFGHLSSIDDAWDELNADESDDGHFHDQYGFGTIFGITPEYAQLMMFKLV